MERLSVTVGMVVHNDPGGLRRSVPMVFAQTWPGPLRLVVVDDGSTDDTPEVLGALSRHYDRIEIVRNPTRRGWPAVLAQVAELAGDDYLAWLDPGDVWHPRKLELQLAALLAAERADPERPLLATATLRRVSPGGADIVAVPDAGGWVRSAQPPASLSTLVGQAAHFRADVLAQVAAADGFVTPDNGTPLCTRVEPPTPRRASGRARPGQPTARRVARLLRPVLRTLRNAGAANLVRRIAVLQRLARAERLRAFRQEPTVRPADIEALEAEVAAAGAAAPVRTWLRLEQAYRLCGRLHSAERTLRRALEQHPADPQLTVRLIEVLPLRRKWAEAAGLWSGLDPTGRRHGTGLTYARVARSWRELRDFAAALTVAEEGVAKFGQEPDLVEERYANRAALVDWGQAVGTTRSSPRPYPGAGLVTSLGFLAGGDGPIQGRVTRGGASSVSLLVNGRPVASTGVTPDAASFSLSCHDLRAFLGDGDVVSVECDGEPLSIEGHGPRCEITTGYESRLGDLWRRLAAGHVFTKFGELRMGNTPQRKDETLALFGEVAEVLAGKFGFLAYPFYGNLLGAVRDHDFIAHDVGGFDMGYVSERTRPEEVRREFQQICRELVDRGFRLRLEPWSAYVRHHDGEAFVDLNFGWFSEKGELGLSFGWRYQPVTDSDHFFSPRDCPIAGHLVPVPGNAEAVLEQLYGSSWAVPEQGFPVEAGLQRDTRMLLTPAEQEELFAYSPDQVLIRSVLAEDGQVVAYLGD